MRQVRIHGRGGQGVVTAAEMLARAGFLAGHEAQAIPSFGSERTGAPVVAYCRFADVPLRTREPVLAPDVVLVQDPTLLAPVQPFSGLAHDGLMIVNTTADAPTVRAEAGAAQTHATVITVPATTITMSHLGRPKPAAAMLAAYAAASDDITLDAVQRVFRQRFPGAVGEANAAAAADAYGYVRAELAGTAGGGGLTAAGTREA
ncbi:2-oxoacid:acceptor oxidoreductase family protein [Demequina capsici]|uniref:2-oxoacid:acceptor oxidoreductase family protein n=1 Tax=Demequina capsici TaxID=3075620 RepID=A0AA96FEA7_9MICO|nr:2-oxoacid:acceptor oxidoreductase family protein [Demequina sp. PMTSA13]WNM28764.1 2-oxoacid:acceptor oxidoreductase family protein [Demequina sp. PMTSA13]